MSDRLIVSRIVDELETLIDQLDRLSFIDASASISILIDAKEELEFILDAPED